MSLRTKAMRVAIEGSCIAEGTALPLPPSQLLILLRAAYMHVHVRRIELRTTWKLEGSQGGC
jgi:hypothetical protein